MNYTRQGSALLTVILMTTVIMLYASIVFWIDALFRQSVADLIKVQKISILADSLARYAVVWYQADKLLREVVEIDPWPPGTQSSYRGVIHYAETSDGADITAQVLDGNRVLQTITFSLINDSHKGRITKWQRDLA